MIYGLVVMRIFFNTSCLLKAGALQDMCSGTKAVKKNFALMKASVL
nr:MAG TPA: hypothetical protein [Microviridae sp.]